MGKFKKGEPRPKGAGRKPGSPNKTPIQLKEAVLRALDAVGGDKYLIKLARKNPYLFVQLLGRILPLQASISGQVLVGISIELQQVLSEHDGQSRSIPAKPNGQIQGPQLAVRPSLLDS
jgi:hypothetical protein